MNEDGFTDLAPDYALGLLEGEELDAFERHLAAGCAACERELATMDAVGDALACSVRTPAPPDALRVRVLEAIDRESAREPAGALAPVSAAPPPPLAVPVGQALYPGQSTASPTYAPPSPWWMRLAPPLAIAALIAAALAGTWAYRLDRRLAFVRGDLERVQAENQALARILDVVQSDPLRVVALAGLEAAPAARGRILWAPGKRQAVLHAFDLPRPPAGKDYQLWVIVGGTARSEGVFPVGDDGRATHVLPEAPAAGGASAFSVTLEPAGGMPQPTGDTVLLGAVTVDG